MCMCNAILLVHKHTHLIWVFCWSQQRPMVVVFHKYIEIEYPSMNSFRFFFHAARRDIVAFFSLPLTHSFAIALLFFVDFYLTTVCRLCLRHYAYNAVIPTLFASYHNIWNGRNVHAYLFDIACEWDHFCCCCEPASSRHHLQYYCYCCCCCICVVKEKSIPLWWSVFFSLSLLFSSYVYIHIFLRSTSFVRLLATYIHILLYSKRKSYSIFIYFVG